jgi:hypothetical protein
VVVKGLNVAQFMILIRGGDDGWETMTPEDIQLVMQRYNEWGEKLRSEGSYVDANQLTDTGAVIQGSTVTDGPFAETKEGIGGYYIVEAAGLDEATEIARGCPALLYNATVEVRGFVDHSGQ